MICVSVTLGVDVPPRDRVEMQAAGAADNLFPIEDVRVYVNDVLQPKSHVEVSVKRDVGEGELTIVNKSRNVWVKDVTLTVCWPEPGEVPPPITPPVGEGVITPVTGGSLAMEAGTVMAIGEILSIAATTGQQLITSAGSVVVSTIRNAVADVLGAGLTSTGGGLAVSAGGGVSVGVAGLGLTASAGTPFIWARIPSSVTLTGQAMAMTAGTTSGVPGVRSSAPVGIKKKEEMAIRAGTVSVTTTRNPVLPPPTISVIVTVAGQAMTASAGTVTVSATVGGSVNVFYPATGLPAPVTQITVTLTSYTAGTGYAVNTISPHGTNAVGTCFSTSSWTSPLTTTKYLTASDVRYFLFAGTYYSRDQSVSGYCRFGEAFLRYVGGKAWCFTFNFEGSGSLDISLCEGLTQGTSSLIRYSATAVYYAFGTSTLNADIHSVLPAYNPSATNAHRFKCAAEGLDLVFYYSLDGTTFSEVHRITSPEYATWLHMTPGAVAIASVGSGYGWRDFTIDYDDTPVVYLSDFTTTLYVSDIGIKQVDTTGSIASGTPTLTVADASGFSVGDHIIVDTAGTVAAGAKGSRGPGGVWPYLRYANAAAMNADTSKPANTLCSLEDTGFIWRFESGAWARMADSPGNQYVNKSLPLALRARITNIAGSVLTLDTVATISATASGVTFDCAPILNSLFRNEGYGVTIPALEFRYPDADVVIGSMVSVYGKPGWSHVGEGSGIPNSDPDGLTTWWAPHGCPSACMTIADYCSGVRDMYFACGAYQAFPQLGTDTMTDQTSYTVTYPHALRLSLITGCAIANIGVEQVWQQAVTVSYCHNVTIDHCRLRMTDALERYIQWSFQSANSTGIIFRDCEMDADYMTTFCEPFSDDGTKFIRCVARNGVSSNNTSVNTEYTDCGTVLEEDSRWSYDSQSVQNPVIQSNANIGGGGTFTSNAVFERFRYKLEGYVDAADEQPKGIVISSCNGDIVRNSILEMLPYSATSTLNGAQGVIIDSSDCLVENTRVEGTTIASYSGNITAYDATASGTDIVNCVADRQNNSQTGGTLTGAQTVAAAGTDRTPGAIAFTDVTGATPGQTYTSNEITITGVNALLRDVTLTSGARFIWNGSALVRNHDHWLLKLLKNGDRIKLVAEAPATVTLQLASGHTTDWVLSV